MKIGDKVKIINGWSSCLYSIHTDKFVKMGFKNIIDKNLFYQDFLPYKNTFFTIFAKLKCNSNINIYGIEDNDGNQFLFYEYGLELVEIIVSYTIDDVLKAVNHWSMSPIIDKEDIKKFLNK